MGAPGWLREDGDGCLISVRVTPRAASDGVVGVMRMDDGTEWLALRVRAVPDKGAANAAVAATLAKALGIAKSEARVVAGSTSRLKRLRVALPLAAVAAALDAAR